ncbi:MAG TPA: GAF domain-containing protein, partial [Gaiellaceae bacterium]|nr:GAF domain-containing protein [Gaiellaceae bacterium]
MSWTTAIVAASAVAAACVGAGLAVRARVRAERRFALALARVDEHMAAISSTLASALETAVEPRRPAVALPVGGFAELLEELAETARTLVGADALALRVEGPSSRPVLVTTSPGLDPALLESLLAGRSARDVRAATVQWTYGPSEQAHAAYRSALVVPVLEGGEPTGVLAACSAAPEAFGSEQAAAVRALLEEVAPTLSAARRLARVESGSVVDPATGVRNNRGYRQELEREVARAERTGRPLSLVVVDADGEDVREVAALLSRLVRSTDVACRRRAHELALVLPETPAAGAERLVARVREEAARTLATGGGARLALRVVE